jgi:hypothetical protein
MRTDSHARPGMRPEPSAAVFRMDAPAVRCEVGTRAVVKALLASWMAAGVDALATYEVARLGLQHLPSK